MFGLPACGTGGEPPFRMDVRDLDPQDASFRTEGQAQLEVPYGYAAIFITVTAQSDRILLLDG